MGEWVNLAEVAVGEGEELLPVVERDVVGAGADVEAEVAFEGWVLERGQAVRQRCGLTEEGVDGLGGFGGEEDRPPESPARDRCGERSR